MTCIAKLFYKISEFGRSYLEPQDDVEETDQERPPWVEAQDSQPSRIEHLEIRPQGYKT